MSDVSLQKAPANNQPPPVGVYGSVERILMFSAVATTLPKVPDPNFGEKANIWLYERPEQAPLYECVVITSGKATQPEETFEGFKLKSYPCRIDIFGSTDDKVSIIARQLEKVMEDPRTPAQIALWLDSLRDEDDCGISILDEGEDYDRERGKYSPNSDRPYVCRWYWSVVVKYNPQLRRQLPLS